MGDKYCDRTEPFIKVLTTACNNVCSSLKIEENSYIKKSLIFTSYVRGS